MTEIHNPVIWFEIPASDLGRARVFYESVLGIEMETEDMGPLQMAKFPIHDDTTGAMGALVQGEGYIPSRDGTLVFLSVRDIDAVLSEVELHGGKVLATKKTIGEYGFIGLMQDSEGNRVGLHSTR